MAISNKEAVAKYKAKIVATGMCHGCKTRARDGRQVLCSQCRAQAKNRRLAKITDGLCEIRGCSNEADSGTYCMKHRCFKKQATLQIKRDVFAHYGGSCYCCGESNIAILCLDHKNEDGAAHRRTFKGSNGAGVHFYRWVKRNGYPEDYRVACWSCNSASYHNNGICPHQTEMQNMLGSIARIELTY
ncbi:hypothetical protein AYO40_01175 [Planctomycetaceae bacterium SCGC AG-212-D15]|nr:hypothetical protein AYO40_01175 [Planctomycetaceae bacterium SCGC AG-212-D15]